MAQGQIPAINKSGLGELFARLRFVLLAIIVYRIGTHIPVPGIDPAQLAALFNQNQGTILGLALSYRLQTHGLDLSAMMDNMGVMMPTVFRAVVTPSMYVVGFIPGVLAMVFGSALAGYAIYKRKTAQLFKELEV